MPLINIELTYNKLFQMMSLFNLVIDNDIPKSEKLGHIAGSV